MQSVTDILSASFQMYKVNYVNVEVVTRYRPFWSCSQSSCLNSLPSENSPEAQMKDT